MTLINLLLLIVTILASAITATFSAYIFKENVKREEGLKVNRFYTFYTGIVVYMVSVYLMSLLMPFIVALLIGITLEAVGMIAGRREATEMLSQNDNDDELN